MDPKRNLWINQLGYNRFAPKICVAVQPPVEDFEVQTIDESVTWKTVFKGKFIQTGDRHIADFSVVTTAADYRLICGDKDHGGLSSNYFVIKDDVYDTAERMFLTYYTWQRCGSPKGWAGICHQTPVPLRGTNRTLDVRGGYHQSGDLRIWAEGISLSLYALMRYAELKSPLWDQGSIAEELRWGCDYFLKLVGPEGYAYDSQFVPIGWGARDYYVSPAPLSAQMNIAMLLARASRFFADDSPYATRCLQTAMTLWHSIETNPFFDSPYTPPVDKLPRGTQGANFHFQTYKTSATGLAGRTMVALELYQATRDISLKETACALCRQFLALQFTDGDNAGAFRQDMTTDVIAFSDCSYNYNLNSYRTALEIYRQFDDTTCRDAFLKSCEWLKQRVIKADFKGIPTSKTLLSTSSAAAGSLAILLSEAAQLTGDTSFAMTAQRCLDWVFGVNPEEASYITGIGYRHKQHLVFGQFFPSTPQIPGGVAHVMGGEYDMPAVAMVLWACGTLSHYQHP